MGGILKGQEVTSLNKTIDAIDGNIDNKEGETTLQEKKLEEAKQYLKSYKEKGGEKGKEAEREKALNQAITKVAEQYVKEHPELKGKEKEVEAEIIALINATDTPAVVPTTEPGPRVATETTPDLTKTPNSREAALVLFNTIKGPLTRGAGIGESYTATTGDDKVKALQRLCCYVISKDVGTLFPGFGTDGKYGTQTEEAVKQLQKTLNADKNPPNPKLGESGIFDQKTLDALKKYLGTPADHPDTDEKKPQDPLTDQADTVTAAQGATGDTATTVAADRPAEEKAPAVAPAIEGTPKPEVAQPSPDIQKNPILWQGDLSDDVLANPETQKMIDKLLIAKHVYKTPIKKVEIYESGARKGKIANVEINIIFEKTTPTTYTKILNTTFETNEDPAINTKNLVDALKKALVTPDKKETTDTIPNIQSSDEVKTMIIRDQKAPGQMPKEDDLKTLLSPEKFKEYSEAISNKIPNSLTIAKEELDTKPEELKKKTTEQLNSYTLSALGIKLPKEKLKTDGKMAKMAEALLKVGNELKPFSKPEEPNLEIAITATDKANILQAFLTDNAEILEAIAKTKDGLDKSLLESNKQITEKGIEGISINLSERKISIDPKFVLVGEPSSKYLSTVDLRDYSSTTITKFEVKKDGEQTFVNITEVPTSSLPGGAPKEKKFTLKQLPSEFTAYGPDFFREKRYLPESYKDIKLSMTSSKSDYLDITMDGIEDTSIKLDHTERKTEEKEEKELKWSNGILKSFLNPGILKSIPALRSVNPNENVAVLEWQSSSANGKIIFTEKGIISINSQDKCEFIPKKEKSSDSLPQKREIQMIDMEFTDTDLHPSITTSPERLAAMKSIIDNPQTSGDLASTLLENSEKGLVMKFPKPVKLEGEIMKIAKEIFEKSGKEAGKMDQIFLSDNTKKCILAAAIKDNKDIFETALKAQETVTKNLKEFTKVDGLKVNPESQTIILSSDKIKTDSKLVQGNTLDLRDFSDGKIVTGVRLDRSAKEEEENVYILEITKITPDGKETPKEQVKFTKLNEQERSVETARGMILQAGYELEGKTGEKDSYKLKGIEGVTIKIENGKVTIQSKGSKELPIDKLKPADLKRAIQQGILENTLTFAIKPELPQEVLDDKEIFIKLEENKEGKGSKYSYFKIKGDIFFRQTDGKDTTWTSFKTGEKFNKKDDSSIEKADITDARKTFDTAGYTLGATPEGDGTYKIKSKDQQRPHDFATVKFESGKITITGLTQKSSKSIDTKDLEKTLKPTLTRIEIEEFIGSRISESLDSATLDNLKEDMGVIATLENKRFGTVAEKYQYFKTESGIFFAEQDKKATEWTKLDTGKKYTKKGAKFTEISTPQEEQGRPAAQEQVTTATAAPELSETDKKFEAAKAEFLKVKPDDINLGEECSYTKTNIEYKDYPITTSSGEKTGLYLQINTTKTPTVYFIKSGESSGNTCGFYKIENLNKEEIQKLIEQRKLIDKAEADLADKLKDIADIDYHSASNGSGDAGMNITPKGYSYPQATPVDIHFSYNRSDSSPYMEIHNGIEDISNGTKYKITEIPIEKIRQQILKQKETLDKPKKIKEKFDKKVQEFSKSTGIKIKPEAAEGPYDTEKSTVSQYVIQNDQGQDTNVRLFVQQDVNATDIDTAEVALFIRSGDIYKTLNPNNTEECKAISEQYQKLSKIKEEAIKKIPEKETLKKTLDKLTIGDPPDVFGEFTQLAKKIAKDTLGLETLKDISLPNGTIIGLNRTLLRYKITDIPEDYKIQIIDTIILTNHKDIPSLKDITFN